MGRIGHAPFIGSYIVSNRTGFPVHACVALYYSSQIRVQTSMVPVYVFFLWVTAYGIVTSLLGALVIVPSAPILLQLGLSGPVQVFTSLPDARAMFTYPVSIAPMIGVPLFVLVNLWVTSRLWEQSPKES